MTINDGGTAFPCEQHQTQESTWNHTFESGMTLRDYFAAKALAGYISNQDWLVNAHTATGKDPGYCASVAAYEAADAMIAAREVQS